MQNFKKISFVLEFNKHIKILLPFLGVGALFFFVLPYSASAFQLSIDKGVQESMSGKATITSSPAGINCYENCSLQWSQFPDGVIVTLTAVPIPGSILDSWSITATPTGQAISPVSGCVAPALSCTVLMNTDIRVRALFNLNPNPTVNISANPTSILQGQNSTLAWTSQNTTSCSAFWTNSAATGGSGIVAPNVTTTFSITCFGLNGRSVSNSATVFVNQIQQQQLTPTVVLFADQESLPFGGAATVRWISANATSCNASGGSLGWTGEKSVGSGSFFTGPLTSNATYLITCSNNFASAADSVRVAVRQALGAATARPTSLVLITSSLDRNQPIVPTINNTKPHPGDEINYAINYQNIGAGAITGLSLRIDLPLEVDYIPLNQNNPAKFGSALVFNLGTLRANGQGSVAVRARLRDDVPAETKLNFLATLSYIDPSGLPQSVSANVTAEVWDKSTADINKNIFLGANVFGTDFLPRNLFEWLILLTLALILIFLAKHLYDQPFRKKTPAVIITDKPSNRKKYD